jgi:type III secretory pathway component EscT
MTSCPKGGSIMTQLQEIMLAVCFGSVIGAFLGNLISIIIYAVSGCGQMKRKHKTAQEAAEKSE